MIDRRSVQSPSKVVFLYFFCIPNAFLYPLCEMDTWATSRAFRERPIQYAGLMMTWGKLSFLKNSSSHKYSGNLFTMSSSAHLVSFLINLFTKRLTCSPCSWRTESFKKAPSYTYQWKICFLWNVSFRYFWAFLLLCSAIIVFFCPCPILFKRSWCNVCFAQYFWKIKALTRIFLV